MQQSTINMTHAPRRAGVLLLLASLVLSACSSLPSAPPGKSVDSAEPRSDRMLRETYLQQLYSQHREWQGTPYRIGGQSRAGVDCSGFVQLTYRDRLGLELPRTTEQQATLGTPVNPPQLDTGDLVFFLIDGHTRHVGIYLDNQRFLHASKSRGVIISDLDNPYWQGAYWRARRVF